MSLLRLFSSNRNRNRDPSAAVARERLQILLAHERTELGQSDLVLRLREEILAVISRHVTLDPDKVVVKMDKGTHVSTLEVDIELPNEPLARAS
jgi:cell division topological specificity factor